MQTSEISETAPDSLCESSERIVTRIQVYLLRGEVYILSLVSFVVQKED